jgi:hypothetical protein
MAKTLPEVLSDMLTALSLYDAAPTGDLSVVTTTVPTTLVGGGANSDGRLLRYADEADYAAGIATYHGGFGALHSVNPATGCMETHIPAGAPPDLRGYWGMRGKQFSRRVETRARLQAKLSAKGQAS